jgi:CBS domain-containing protein
MICPSCGHENIDGSDRCENCLSSFRDLDVPRADSAEGLVRSVMEDTLAQLHTETPVYVKPETPAIEVARLLKNFNTGCALVIENNRLAGIFTSRDALSMLGKRRSRRAPAAKEMAAEAGVSDAAILAEMPLNQVPASDIPTEELRAEAIELSEGMVERNEAPIPDLNVAVKELMSPNPETLHEQDSVAAALNKMSLGRYRHIPFIKRDGSYGVASIKSVLKYISREDW